MIIESFKKFTSRFFLQKKPLTETAIKGQLAEEAAVQHLKAKGYKVVARNWRSGQEEIDIICAEGKILVFVEVRGRSINALVGGYASLTKRKRDALRRGGAAYLRGLKVKPITVRWDVVEVALSFKSEVVDIFHYTGVTL